jgi:hypothetical protein
MALEVPEWLARHGGSLKDGFDDRTCFVMLSGQPLYAIVPRPVEGKFGCTIIQVNNGKRIESNATAASGEEALRQGLEELRQALGW